MCVYPFIVVPTLLRLGTETRDILRPYSLPAGGVRPGLDVYSNNDTRRRACQYIVR